MSCEYCKIEPFYFEDTLYGKKTKEYINGYKIARILKVRDGFELQCAELSCGNDDIVGAWKSIKITHCPWCGEKLDDAEWTTELLPCPFCGNEADVVEMTTKCDEMKFFKISCNDCFCPGANIHMWYKTEAEAIIAWNTRTDEQSEQIVIEEPDTIRNEFEDNGLLVDDEAEQDTREKLEEDARQVAFDWSPDTTPNGNPEYELRAEIIALLDRQAAITEREVCKGVV